MSHSDRNTNKGENKQPREMDRDQAARMQNQFLNQLAKSSIEENKKLIEETKKALTLSNPEVSKSINLAKDDLSKKIALEKPVDLESLIEDERERTGGEEFFQNNPYIANLYGQSELAQNVKNLQEVTEHGHYSLGSLSEEELKNKYLNSIEMQEEQQKQLLEHNIQKEVIPEFKKRADNIKNSDLSQSDKQNLLENINKELIQKVEDELKLKEKELDKQVETTRKQIADDDLTYQTLDHNAKIVKDNEKQIGLIENGSYVADHTLRELYKKAMVNATAQISRLNIDANGKSNSEIEAINRDMKEIVYSSIVHELYGKEVLDENLDHYSSLENLVLDVFKNGIDSQTQNGEYEGELSYDLDNSLFKFKKEIYMNELIDGIDYKSEDIEEFCSNEKILNYYKEIKKEKDLTKQAVLMDLLYNRFTETLSNGKMKDLHLKNILSRFQYTGKSMKELKEEFEADKKLFQLKYLQDEQIALETALLLDDDYSIFDLPIHNLKSQKHFRHTHIKDGLSNKHRTTSTINPNDRDNILNTIQVSDIHLYKQHFIENEILETLRESYEGRVANASYKDFAVERRIRYWILDDMDNLITDMESKGVNVDLLSFDGDFIEGKLHGDLLQNMIEFELAKRGGDHRSGSFTTESVEFESDIQNYYQIEQQLQKAFMSEFGYMRFEPEEALMMLHKLKTQNFKSESEKTYAQNLTKIIRDYELQDEQRQRRSLFIREEMMSGSDENLMDNGLFGKFEIELQKLLLLKEKMGGFLGEYEDIKKQMSLEIARKINHVAEEQYMKRGIVSIFQLGNHDDSYMALELTHGVNLAIDPVYIHRKGDKKIKITGSINCDGHTTVGQRASTHLGLKGRQYQMFEQVKKHHPEIIEKLNSTTDEHEKKLLFQQVHDWLGYHGYDLEFHRLKGIYSENDKDSAVIHINHNPASVGQYNAAENYGLKLNEGNSTSGYATLIGVEALLNHSTRDLNNKIVEMAGHVHRSKAVKQTLNGEEMDTYITTAENPMLVSVDMRNGKSSHKNLETEDELDNALNVYEQKNFHRFDPDGSTINTERVKLDDFKAHGFNSKEAFKIHLLNSQNSLSDYEKFYRPVSVDRANELENERYEIGNSFYKQAGELIDNYGKFNDIDRKLILDRQLN